jgi:Zn-dependent M28 family amino/carboxypeptidase
MGSVTGFLRALDQDNIIPKLALVQNCGKMQYPLGYRVYKFPVVEFRDKVIKKKIDYLEISIKANWQENYSTQNVWAMVEGTKYKDSLYVFTAHYDHLGKIGKDCYFPGANDNASGVSVLLDLSKYYAQNPSDYSIVFIFTSAEEMGLLGAKYAAENPLIDLSKVKFLLNLDMCGTGSGGIALINGEKEIKASLQIQKINDDKRYFNQIRIGGESCNSDHCPFVQRGVPAFFIFTFGCEYNEYHTIYDNGKDLSFTKHIDLCNILKDFIETYNR